MRQAGPCRLKALGHTAFHLRRAQRAESGLGESGRLQPSAVPALGTELREPGFSLVPTNLTAVSEFPAPSPRASPSSLEPLIFIYLFF